MFRVDTINVFGGFGDRAFTQVTSGRSGSTGSVSRSVIRSKLIKNIYDVVSSANTNLPFGCKAGATNVTVTTLRTCKPNPKVQMYQLSNVNNTRKVLNYSTIKSFLEAPITATNPAPRTLVLVGYDLVINDNIDPNNDNLPSIVLLTNKHGRGGFTYITSDVNEVSGYFYIDKSFISVEDLAMANSVDSEGVPTQYLLRDLSNFYNDIVFVGKFWGENCVGCALGNPPTKGDGSISESIEASQPFDFNYFRMSSIKFSTVTSGGREYYADCNGVATPTRVTPTSVVPPSAICWVQPDGATTSEYLATLRTSVTDPGINSQSGYRSVNFLTKDANKVPILGDL